MNARRAGSRGAPRRASRRAAPTPAPVVATYGRCFAAGGDVLLEAGVGGEHGLATQVSGGPLDHLPVSPVLLDLAAVLLVVHVPLPVIAL